MSSLLAGTHAFITGGGSAIDIDSLLQPFIPDLPLASAPTGEAV